MSWGFSTLLVKKGMDIVLPLTLKRLSANYQPIHLSDSLSHYFSLSLSNFISQVLALRPTFFFSPLLTHSSPPVLLSLSQTHVCSPSIIFNTPFPEQRCMPEMETKRLWYKPGCVGRASYLHVGFNQFVFGVERERIGFIRTIQAYSPCSARPPSLAGCIWVPGCVSVS